MIAGCRKRQLVLVEDGVALTPIIIKPLHFSSIFSPLPHHLPARFVGQLSILQLQIPRPSRNGALRSHTKRHLPDGAQSRQHVSTDHRQSNLQLQSKSIATFLGQRPQRGRPPVEYRRNLCIHPSTCLSVHLSIHLSVQRPTDRWADRRMPDVRTDFPCIL